MKAMVLKQPDEIENHPLIELDVNIPTLSPKQNLLKIKSCGVCHTDLHIVEGDLNLPKLPLIPGHEIIAEVEKVGSDKSKFKEGDIVGVSWLNSSCGKCKFCKRGFENLCSDIKFTGLNVNGGYTEYIAISDSYMYNIPKKYSISQAAPLMCAGVIGYRSYKLSEIKKGEILGLYGFGASAHIVIQMAKYYGIETYVFTRSKNHQNHAKQLGANWVGSSKDISPNKIDKAISFTPSGPLIIDILSNLEKGGSIAINAIHLSNIPEIPWRLLYNEKSIKSIANVTRNDAVEFLSIAKDLSIKTDITTYNLNKANEALFDVKHSKVNGAAILEM